MFYTNKHDFQITQFITVKPQHHTNSLASSSTSKLSRFGFDFVLPFVSLFKLLAIVFSVNTSRFARVSARSFFSVPLVFSAGTTGKAGNLTLSLSPPNPKSRTWSYRRRRLRHLEHLRAPRCARAPRARVRPQGSESLRADHGGHYQALCARRAHAHLPARPLRALRARRAVVRAAALFARG